MESTNFKPIVSISAVGIQESSQINLVAISETGVRFYLSTASLSNTQLNSRPYALTLAHIRLAPGYSATMTIQPRMVHLANYKDRNLVMVTTVNESDVLWCLNSDLFPFTNSLMEFYNKIPLDGPVFAIAEVNKRLFIQNISYKLY